MKIHGLIWIDRIVDKLEQKHHVYAEEVEEVFNSIPHFRRIEKGKVINENLYMAMGRTLSGRYLVVYFIYKRTQQALIVTARDMDEAERRLYEKR